MAISSLARFQGVELKHRLEFNKLPSSQVQVWLDLSEVELKVGLSSGTMPSQARDELRLGQLDSIILFLIFIQFFTNLFIF